jgi:hypothetical protein
MVIRRIAPIGWDLVNAPPAVLGGGLVGLVVIGRWTSRKKWMEDD